MEATSTPPNLKPVIQGIKDLGPWHMDIQLKANLSSCTVLGEQPADDQTEDKKKVEAISPKNYFFKILDGIYPDGMKGKTFMDSACNAGGYCFWARERDVQSAYGFDVRQHWIDQAKFIQEHRTVAPTNRINFEIMDLYDIPKRNLKPVSMTMFKGIFYHLPDPITGLKLASDLTEEVMWLNTQTLWDETDGYLKLGKECVDHVMSGVHGLKWYPTGPNVLMDILSWLGYKDMKLTLNAQNPLRPHLGRCEIIASKIPGQLDGIRGLEGRSRFEKMPGQK